MRLSTSAFRSIGQPEIFFDIEAEAAPLAKWLLEYFESLMLSGARFEDGQIVELGWSLLYLRRDGGGLEICEPDFDSLPIRWCSGVNNTIRHLGLQRAVCDLFSREPEFPTLRQAGVASPNFSESVDFVMSRGTASASDSGWVFAEVEYSGVEGEFFSLYHLALQKIVVVPFLALPPGSRVRISPGFIEVSVNDDVISSEESEFLYGLANASILI